MKRNHCLIVLIAFFASSFAGIGVAQNERAYARLFYIDVKPGKSGEYRKFQREVWSKVDQVRAAYATDLLPHVVGDARQIGPRRLDADEELVKKLIGRAPVFDRVSARQEAQERYRDNGQGAEDVGCQLLHRIGYCATS